MVTSQFFGVFSGFLVFYRVLACFPSVLARQVALLGMVVD